ncbi:MAG: helicase-associated domain-containing protein, partial [Anaerolineae bacterium]|nr:helicase-associated domain-containing protein [Anaerolineae bacterium]
LSDEQRGVLQALLAAPDHKLPAAMFKRIAGEIRQMGTDRLVREKPYLAPASHAEALYYLGLIAYGGGQAFVYVPSDLAPLLPTEKTGYDLSAQQQRSEPLPSLPEPQGIRPADTSLVDDLTTFLVACYVEDFPLVNDSLSDEQRMALEPYFIGKVEASRMALIVSLALDIGLAALENGKIKPVPAKARVWLDAPRPAQVRALAEGWQGSRRFNELLHVPTLKVEWTGTWQNDPLLARQAVCSYLEMVPPNGWWSVDELIETIHEEEPDFMRPDGNYESWYIRDAKTNRYLRGFEHWHAVDGAVLRFILTVPMHLLGLVDVAEGGKVCRLTPYGRALVSISEWPPNPPPNAPNEGKPITVDADGTCRAVRATNRYERFQLARFTNWIGGVSSTEGYQYLITAESVARAQKQGVRVEQIITFLRRVTGDKVPTNVIQQLQTWATAQAQTATLEQLWVLRLPSEALLDKLFELPKVRRYFGARLGAQAVAVRADQREALIKALRENNLQVEVSPAE